MVCTMKQRRGHCLAILTAVLLVVPLAACSAGMSGNSDTGSRATHEGSAESGSFSEMDVAQAPSTSESGEATPKAEPTLIQTGSISIEVSDPLEAADQTTKIADDLGGQVASRTLSRSSEDGGATAQLTLRVPADQFEATLTALEEVGQVQSRNNSAVDVTAEYVDLQARVEALQASVARLTELMADSTSS